MQSLTHLSVLVQDLETGSPLARVPIFAEVELRGVRTVAPDSQPDERFQDATVNALREIEESCFAKDECRSRVQGVVTQGMTDLLAGSSRDELAADPETAQAFVAGVLRRARTANGGRRVGPLGDEKLRSILNDAIREEADAARLLVRAEADPTPLSFTHPLGVLATDHAGYLSFDLKRLPPLVFDSVLESVETWRRGTPKKPARASVWLYPMTRSWRRFDALSQARFSHDAIVFRMRLAGIDLATGLRHLGLLALQNPALTDWRISPGSFAATPRALLGADGCEALWPSNLALQEFHFYQVVRLIGETGAIQDSRTVRLGVIQDFRIAWYPLGHSLGQVLYSLPLAPGESVNLAVIDWSRQEESRRAEDSKLSERMAHEQRRERTITETVNAALREFQQGSSFMGGAALASGANIPVGPVRIGIGFTGSLGGSSASSSGTRDLAATTVQKLCDNITQASSALREFQSTVVVQSTQTEKEAIETRTVVNYNHSHTLTILYYEVLRHFRVATEMAARRPAVLVPMPSDWLDANKAEDTILQNRPIIKAALLQPELAGGLDALDRVADRRRIKQTLNATPPPPPWDPGTREFAYFLIEMVAGKIVSEDDEKVDIEVVIHSPSANVRLQNVTAPGAPHASQSVLNPPGSFRHENQNNIFTAMPPPGTNFVLWKDIHSFFIEVKPDHSDIVLDYVKVTGIDTAGNAELLVDRNFMGMNGFLFITKPVSNIFPSKRPPFPAPVPARPAEEIADEAKVAELVQHLTHHKPHYLRALILGQSEAVRARLLQDTMLADGTSVFEHVENRPVEVIGNLLAFPCTDGRWALQVLNAIKDQRNPPEIQTLDERLVTLPTRGVFAEAKLGHCNASEEIDDTRFWDWQSSPIPHMAPEIAPVTPVTPQPSQTNLSPTPFPQSLVNIVNPPATPDPAGLAAALTAISTPNIFRDMSGQAQVADLLKKLADGAVTMAQASGQAKDILSKQAAASAAGGLGPLGATVGGARGAAGGSGGGTALGGGSGAMPPGEQLQRMQVVRNAVAHGELTPAEGKDHVSKILDAPPTSSDQIQVVLSDNTPHVRTFGAPTDISGRAAVGASIGGRIPESAQFVWRDPARHVSIIDMPSSPNHLQTWIQALTPGVTNLEMCVLASDGSELTSASVPISVPQFIEIAGDSGDMNSVFARWNLSARRADLLKRARQVASELLSFANVRLIWTVDPIQDLLPEQFTMGSEGEEFLARITLRDKSVNGNFAQDVTPFASWGIFNYGEQALAHLGEIMSLGAPGGCIDALVAELIGGAPAIGAEDFAVEFIGRVLGRELAAMAASMLFGDVYSDLNQELGEISFAERTGFDITPGSDAGKPNSYTDRGTPVMAFSQLSRDLGDKYFPVPPAFK